MENESQQPKQPSLASQASQKVVSKGVSTLGNKAASQLTTKLATSAAGKAAGALVASLAGPAGHLAFLAARAVGDLTKAFGLNREGMGSLLGGSAMGLAGLGFMGVGGALPAAAAMGLAAFATSGVGAFTGGAAMITNAVLSALSAATALILAGIGTGALLLVTFTVFAFFVINNSAYIVPKGEPPGSTDGEDPDGPIDPGQPGEACFDFTSDWPTTGAYPYRDNMVRATEMLARSTPYINKLCSRGRITLEWAGGESECCSGVGGEQLSLTRLRFWASGSYSYPTAVYTLAHESGHIYYWQDLSRYGRYRDSPANAERPICSYPLAYHPPGEDYAEMIALYIRLAPGLGGPLGVAPGSLLNCAIPMTSKYPETLNFAIQDIFDGVRHGW